MFQSSKMLIISAIKCKKKKPVYFSRYNKGFLLEPVLQKELMCQTGCLAFLRMNVYPISWHFQVTFNR